jgi:hypothetical protein
MLALRISVPGESILSTAPHALPLRVTSTQNKHHWCSEHVPFGRSAKGPVVKVK